MNIYQFYNHYFADDLLEQSFKLPPKEALKNLKKRGKNIISSDKWDELDAKAHNKAFTVAKVASADILQMIYDDVEKAKENGWTLKQFQERLLPRLAEAGWTGHTAGKLRVIFETNMAVSFAKNKYKQMKSISAIKPYWLYKQKQKKSKRKSHSKLHNKVFRHDDPIWKKIYPPSDFGCKCSVTALSEKQLKSMGLKVSKGSDYDSVVNDNKKVFPLQITKAWEPETGKYVAGIKQKLNELLDNYKKITDSLPTKGKKLDKEEFNNIINNFKGDPQKEIAMYMSNYLQKRENYINNLPQKTQISLKRYTTEHYDYINDRLRSGKNDNDYNELNKNDLDFELTQDVTLYRGMKFPDDIPDYYRNMSNKYITESLISTSFVSASALKFGNNNARYKHTVLFKFDIKAGTKGGFGTDFEHEFIFDKGTEFSIISIEKFTKPENDKELWVIHVRN